MNQMQKLLLYASLLLVGITLLLGYSIVEEPGANFNLRMGCLVFAEVVLCAECLVFSRSRQDSNRMIPYTLGSVSVWAVYLVFVFVLVLLGGRFSMKWLLVAESIGFALAVIVRVAHEMGGQSIARQEEEDRKALSWRKLASLQGGETADAMLKAFSGDAEVKKAAEALRDGLRYAASSTPGTASIESKIDDTLAALSRAVAESRRDDVLQLCATAAADIKQRHRLALMR